MSEINTGGGAAISGKADVGGDLIGRDQNTIFLTVINHYAAEAQKREQDKAQAAALVAQWQAVDPVAAEARYRQSLIEHYNRLRIFGTSGDVALQNVFTDVYIFAEPLSRIPYDFDTLRMAMAEEVRPRLQHRSSQRVNGMQLVKEGKNLFILGKPGAGKTTFLKCLTVQAAQHKLNRLPIFISLNEWANSRWARGNDLQLLPFIVRQFEFCHFDDAGVFVEALLRSGHALVLFDGFDEVRQEDEQRRKLTQLLKDFARQYDRSQHLITCRIAASDYAFPGFRDVEVADFTDGQVNEYAELWFRTANKSHETFLTELAKPDNAGVRELCNSPLLLSMVCLYFERVMRFPPNRAELYEDAIEALLSKWDSSRDILRDEIPHGEMIYRELSPRRKEQLFAAIAARTFETGDYYFRRRDLAKWIGDYLHTLPNVTPNDELDNDAVLRAIEAQHGIFVERARDIYSFSHLTFHEYFTARYIFDNEQRGTIARLLRDHLSDNRWREVFLLIVSLFDSEGTKNFFHDMKQAIDRLITENALYHLLVWADQHTMAATSPKDRRFAVRLAYIFLIRGLEFESDLDLSLVHTLRLDSLDRARSRALEIDLASDLALELEFDPALTSYLELAVDLELVHDFSLEVAFDYGLYFCWKYAKLFGCDWWLRDEDAIKPGMATYPHLIEGLKELSMQTGHDNYMTELVIPTPSASNDEWQQLTDRMHAIMQARDLVPNWHFTSTLVEVLNSYLSANELLVQCLKVAVVSDRQAILNNLFAPPKID